MSYIIVVILIFIISIFLVQVGCFIGILYNILEWVFNRTFKWMYPIAGIFWVVGFTLAIVSFVLIQAWKIYEYIIT